MEGGGLGIRQRPRAAFARRSARGGLIAEVVQDQSAGELIGKVVNGDVLEAVLVGDVILDELPAVGHQDAMQGGMQAEPTILCLPKFLERQLVLPCLIVVVNTWRYLEVL